jgi:aryl-alcohol dehydrogenase-like predicted oxidoreductase
MKYVHIGKTGVYGSVLGLGTMTFGENNVQNRGGVGQELANLIVKKAIDLGVNFFDTSDIYDEGSSEEVLGKAMKDYRDKVLIATKVRGRSGTGVNETGLSRHHINAEIRNSLRRLGTGWVDFYQFHGWDNVAHLEGSVETMQSLVDQGLVNYPGVSNFYAWQMAKAQTICEERNYARFETAQVNYSLLNRDIEHEILPFTRQNDLTILAWSPLHGGVLTGKYGDLTNPSPGTRMRDFAFPVRGGYFPPFELEKGRKILEVVKRVSEEQGATMGQVSLSWLIERRVIVLVGARTMDQFDNNMGALDVVLTKGQKQQLDDVSRVEKQYPQWMVERQNSDRKFPILT